MRQSVFRLLPMASSDPSNPPRTSKTSAPNGAALKSNIKPTQTLHGIWRKDFEQSDMIAMNKALDGMQLSKMQKMAAMNVINGLAIDLSAEDRATVKFRTKVPIPFKVTETFHRGQETQMARRDLRAGKQRAFTHSLGAQEMTVELEWGGDLGGRVHETFTVDEKGQLVVRGVMELQGQKYDVLQVYTKE